MSNTIVKEYTAFAANGFKSWRDQQPMVEVVTCSDGSWVNVDLTIAQAEQAIEILKTAIQEAHDYKLASFDETPF